MNFSDSPKTNPQEVKFTARLAALGIVALIIALFAINLQNSNKETTNNSRQQYSTREAVSEPHEQKTEEPAIKITARKLNSEYQANEVVADEKYKGKLILLHGTVEKISKDFADDPYIVLSTGEMFESLQCSVPSSVALQIKKGDVIEIKVRVNGMVLGSVTAEYVH